MNEATLIIWPLVKFQDEYKTHRALGQGQYGEVVLAEHKKSMQKVAVKFFKNCSKAKEKLQIRDEIDILHSLKHENVIRLVHYCTIF